MHLLYRSSSFKDLLISMDFVIGLDHPNYEMADGLRIQNKEERYNFYVIPKVSERKVLNSENAYFLVSYADLESRFITRLPSKIRKGFIFAKAARNAQFCSLPRALSERVLESIHVDEFITTYMLKTCLMIAMDTDSEYDLSSLHDILNTSSAYECAYVLYVILHAYVQKRGSLPFFFDQSIDLFMCQHDINLDYDDKLGCCLKRTLIVGFSEGIMQNLEALVWDAVGLRAIIRAACSYYDWKG